MNISKTLSIKDFESGLKQINPNLIIVLCDTNTKKLCFPKLENIIGKYNFKVFEIEASENSKNIEQVIDLWKQMSFLEANRSSLLVNIGGGVVSDIGGFVASTYHRGIPYINVPTTLLAMVDAAIGGKTGINFSGFKNQVGTFYQPEGLFICPDFLQTLPAKYLRAGYAEMIKHALLGDKNYYQNFVAKQFPEQILNYDDISASATIKQTIVENDLYEKGQRKKLNFGHTIAHAIEAFNFRENLAPELTHGEAVAVGIVAELYLSEVLCNFPKSVAKEVCSIIKNNFEFFNLNEESIDDVVRLMNSDKKNTSIGKINFSLLKDLGGDFEVRSVSNEIIVDSLRFYISVYE
ncbi:MAG: 3-dehydroquinate synthase [Bacteroidales bacterium]|jgi:3-dehydroquinate synthase